MPGSTMLFSVRSSMIFLVSLIGTFEYVLAISRESKVAVVGVTRVGNRLLIRSVELVMLNVYGRG